MKSYLQRQLVSLQTTIENTIAQSIKRFSWNLIIMCQQAVTHELILSLLKLCLLQGLRHQDWFRLIPRREISQMCLIQNKMRQITQINWSLWLRKFIPLKTLSILLLNFKSLTLLALAQQEIQKKQAYIIEQLLLKLENLKKECSWSKQLDQIDQAQNETRAGRSLDPQPFRLQD